ncbi:MAG TPA: DEAD/DEAH box helicase [Coleofasciculaceae cyanobacterium]|jgi:ATP-dependent Lhr-like helicase
MPSSPASGSNRNSSGFHQLHEQVQRWVWEQKWTELRDIQEQAIAPILSANTDLIIAAATAGGKTEAAFLPIFSKLMGDRTPEAAGIQVLYISPLKALINDQERRLSALGERLEIPVHPWHGDVSASRKQRVLRQPSGVLLITPEALEAMFVLRGHELTAIFAALQYVVVDELHSFIGIERGQQLRSLLHRLELAIDRRIPRIGLSATLGEMNLAKDYLRAGEADAVRLIESTDAGQEIKLQIRGYRKVTPIFIEEESDQPEEDSSRDEIDIASHLFKVLRGDKNLIFINRRQDVEKYADLLSRFCDMHHVPHEFMPHHGSLSKELREAAEAALKEDNRPANVVCTSTLELGIDIGAVTSIAQIGTPYSVASTRQRLGRSGRRPSDPAILRIYITEPEITPYTHPEKMLHPSLVQAIAITHLLLQGWYEPPRVGKLHLSTLVQQFLSLIAERGGIRPDRAWRALCADGAFSEVDQSTYVQLLRCLGEQDLIQQTQEGLLLLGLTGERLVNHYSFYTAFKTPEEYRITTVGKTLGTLPIDYPILEGSYLIFAGKRWEVLTVDRLHRVIDVAHAAAGRVPYFGGEPGLVHDRIRQEMFQIYTTETIPIFLDATAKDLLQEARANFLMYGLDQSPIIEHGHQTLLFPWMGSLVTNTLFIQCLKDHLEVDQGAIALTLNDISPTQLLRYLKKLAKADPPDPVLLAAAVRNKITEKHDLFLSEELLCKTYAASFLDVETTWKTIHHILAQ